MTAIKEIPEVAALDAKINTVVHGELYNQHYKEIQHKFWDAIDAIQKRLSAATPPDVEQMAKEVLYRRMAEANQNRENIIALATFKQFYDSPFMKEDWAWIKAALVEMYQAGQSAVQDATPQEGEEDIEYLFSIANRVIGLHDTFLESFPEREDPEEKDLKIAIVAGLKDARQPLQQELSALRSSLSAAQEENKRLRGAMEVFANEIKGEQTK